MTRAAAPPRIGYLLPTRDHAGAGDDEVGPLVELARRAEALGLDSVWAGDSPLARPRADPLLVLAAAARETDRVTLGTAVLLAALRHPILLAHQLATLDRLAGGRLVVGVGAGHSQPATESQFVALGVDYRHRVARLDETVAAMRALWAGGPATFAGRHLRFTDITVAPKPVRPTGPPIWFGGGAPSRVARLADGWLPYPPTVAGYTEGWAAVGDGRAGSVTPALYATVCLDADPDRARRRLRSGIERYYGAPLERVEAVQAMVAGPAAECARWLRGYLDAGAEHVVVRLVADDQPAALAEFAATVLPALRARPVERVHR
jgi:probable F420-dependent oxidoreductase